MTAAGRDSAPGCCHRFALSGWRKGPTVLLQLPARAVLLSSLVIRTARHRRLRALARYWRWQLVRRRGGRAVLIDLLPSVPFSVPGWSQIGGMIVATGSHEPEETSFLDRLVRPGDVFVDVGGNIGFYSIRAASQGARVVAFEPAARAAEALEANVTLAGLRDLAMVQRLALADSDGESWFDQGADVTNHLVTSPGSGRGRVAVHRLDSVAGSIPAPGAGGITIVKIDAEGADLQVLAGARRFLAERRPVLMVEAWDGGALLRDLLEESAYEVFLPRGGGIERADSWFFQANVVGIPAEASALVESRTGRGPVHRPRAPVVRSWS